MSNGSGPIIIHSLIEAGSTPEEKTELAAILERYKANHKCSFGDALKVVRIVWRLIR